MQIAINIPTEFENHFNLDKFEDSLQRIRFDIHKAIIANKNILSGNYEIELLDMLTETFLKCTPLPKGHGDLIDRDELEPDTEWDNYYDGFTSYSEMQIRNADTIIEADKKSEDK